MNTPHLLAQRIKVALGFDLQPKAASLKAIIDIRGPDGQHIPGVIVDDSWREIARVTGGTTSHAVLFAAAPGLLDFARRVGTGQFDGEDLQLAMLHFAQEARELLDKAGAL
jgi:hypothetical protein